MIVAAARDARIFRHRRFTIQHPFGEIPPGSRLFRDSFSGRTEDKFATAKLTPVKSDLVDAPYVKEFPFVVECSVVKIEELGSHTLCLSARWRPPAVRREGRERASQEFIAELLKKYPKDARIHHRLGVTGASKGDFAKAEEHFQTARSHAQPTSELLSDIGYCLYLQRKFPKRKVPSTRP